MAICFLAFCLETAFLRAIREPAESDDARGKESREVLSARSLDSILTSLQEVRMVELAVAGKRYRVVSEPDKVATAVFLIFDRVSRKQLIY
ncbi:MAG: hypothetical protein Kow00128_11830 [Deltaproteobacteria bacterium]